jgi:hypothetical protein
MFSARCKENIHFSEQSSTSPGFFTTMDKNLRAEKITPGLQSITIRVAKCFTTS